jgi:CrcB protein
MIAVLVALAGGLGAAARFVTDGILSARNRWSMPIGTLAINIIGSFLLGVLTGWGRHHGLAADLKAILGTGFLGGYTTFSTASVELARLARAEQPRAAVGLGLGMLTLSALAAWVGLSLP